MPKKMMKMLKVLNEDCEDFSLSGKPFVTEENLRDEYFWKLSADFIGPRTGEGLELDRRPCRNRFLVQVGLMREDNNFPWAAILKWLGTIFPKHFSADFRCLIERCIATALTQTIEERRNYLDLEVNLNFVGPICESIGVERQHLLEMKGLAERVQSMEVTNGLILELSNFITREKIAPVVIINWLRCFNPDFCKTHDIKSAYNVIKPKVKKLKLYYSSFETRSNRRSAALQNMLQRPFELVRKVIPKFIPRKRMKTEHSHVKATVRPQESFVKVETPEPDPEVMLDVEELSSEEEVFDRKGEVQTLLDVTMESIRKLSTTYGGRTKECQRVSFDVLKNNYTLTCKEHPAMSMFERKLQSFTGEVSLSPPVLFLHHIANFLVAAHDAVEEHVYNFEKELVLSSGEKLGRDKLPKFKNFVNMKESATSRYIHMACDILSPRTAGSRGYRKHWIAFCKEKNNPSTLELNHSNQFNNYMEAAAGLIHHYKEIGPFFSDLLLLNNNDDYSNVTLESVTADASDSTIQSLVCVLAIVYCKIFGPFWQLMISGGEYSLFSQYLLCLYQRFLDWSKDPSKMMEPESTTNVFLQRASHEHIFNGVFFFCNLWQTNQGLVKVCLKRVVKGIVTATDKHLKDYLPGGKFSKLPSVEGSLKLEKCTFSVLMAKYLNSHTPPDKKRAASEDESEEDESESDSEDDSSEDSGGDPVKKEVHSVKIQAPARQSIKKEVLPVKKQAQVNKDRRRMSKEYIVSTVTRNGGPCRTRQDVDKMMLRFDGKPREEKRKALRCEIMYQMLILNNTDVNLQEALDSGTHMLHKLRNALPKVKPGFAVVWAPKWMSAKQAIQQQAEAEQKEQQNSSNSLKQEAESLVPI